MANRCCRLTRELADHLMFRWRWRDLGITFKEQVTLATTQLRAIAEPRGREAMAQWPRTLEGSIVSPVKICFNFHRLLSICMKSANV